MSQRHWIDDPDEVARRIREFPHSPYSPFHVDAGLIGGAIGAVLAFLLPLVFNWGISVGSLLLGFALGSGGYLAGQWVAHHLNCVKESTS